MSHKAKNLMHRYGITVDEYDSMYEEQQGRCAICIADIEQVSKSTHVDHDHATLEVRGLLCQQCNVMLGHSRDIPEVLERAADYLRKYK